VNINRAGTTIELPTPDPLQNKVAGESHTAIVGQKEKQIIFFRSEHERLPIEQSLVADVVEGKVVEDQSTLGGVLLACGHLLSDKTHASQRRFHPRQELSHAERLGDVVVCAHLQPHYPIHLVGASSEHDDGHVHLASQDTAHLEAVQSWQHDVQENQVRVLEPRHLQGANTIRGGADLIALLGQVVAKRFQEGNFILYQQNLA
jgi:hypothetical protein